VAYIHWCNSEIEAAYTAAAAARADKLRAEQQRSGLVTGIAAQRIALLSFEESVAQQWALLQVAQTTVCIHTTVAERIVLRSMNLHNAVVACHLLRS
jgi:hypothetical protein